MLLPELRVPFREYHLLQNMGCIHNPGKAAPILPLGFVPILLGQQFYNHSNARSAGLRHRAQGLKIYWNASLQQELRFQLLHHPRCRRQSDPACQRQHHKHVPMNNRVRRPH